MARAGKKTRWLTGCLVAAVATTMWCALPGINEAAVVVQGTDGSEEDTTLKTLPGLPDLTTPGATTQRPPMSAPPNYRQATTPGASTSQALPVPPTYAPGSPASSSSGSAGAVNALPTAPTGYGLYDSPTAQPSQTAPLNQSAPGGLGFGLPQQPTPGSPMGMGVADPAMGRYQSNNVPAATAPRPAAQVSQSQQQLMRGQKPFSDYRAAPAYSPYMSLFRSSDAGRGINNYYEYVRPRLEAQQQSQQVNRDIQGLQDTARLGAQGGQMSGQRPGNVVPGGEAQRAPATFMRFQQYFQQGRRQ